MNRGLLLTMTEPPPQMEEEFNAWYDEEHLAERLSIPGFRSAKRWIADVPRGQGRYLGTYELDSPDVLTTEKYLFHFNNQTPWSRRCLGKAVVFRRWACEQLAPGDAALDPAAKTLLVGLGERRPASFPGFLFTDRRGSPPYAVLVEDQEQASVAGFEFRLYRAYTGKP
ncbi:MAG TPA: hypothetical protein VEB41_10180 [Burkholderiales bacterium]|nr:hypothetical protein [Burkholderiales bacterium]